MNYHSLSKRNDLVSYPVEEHIAIVATVRKLRDVPEIPGKSEFMIRCKVMEIRKNRV